jgi:hypothetical protein
LCYLMEDGGVDNIVIDKWQHKMGSASKRAPTS